MEQLIRTVGVTRLPEEPPEGLTKLPNRMEDEGREPGSSDFGALLRHHRLALGLSQGALAERARLSLRGINALERGHRRTPQRDTLALLAGALALSDGQRRAFEAAAVRPSCPRRRGEPSVTVGPWLSAQSASLPFSLASFVGRDVEIDEIGALIRAHRLVTVTGAGGVGKTQTALHAAAALRDPVEGLRFVALAPLRDPSLVASAIATALGVQEVPNHPLLETLVAFLKNKTMPVLLDNCEHVIGGAATVTDFLLRACPNLQILATSREPLRVAGERAYRLPSLDDADAVALFVDRAQAADAHFTLTDKNRAIVGEICRHLSGIPLAIELAAARVTILPLRALAKALDERFAFLAGGERTAPARHQTMHATIDWSYELLAASEQQLFERLAVFAGGCTIDAASAVCQGKGIAADDVLPLISSLVSKSLVVADLEDDEPRYRLLEPFREYAREKLKAHGEENATAQRHVLAYIEDAERFVSRDQYCAAYYGHPQKEIGNWRAAIRWALTERNDVLGGLRLIGEVVCLWWGTDAVISDARRWIPAAFGVVNEQTPPDLVAKLKLAQAELATHLDQSALQLASAQEAVAYYSEVGDTLRLVRAQTLLGGAHFRFGQTDEAFAILEETLSIARRLGSRWDLWRVLRNLGLFLLDHDLAASRTYLTEASQLLQAVDDRYNIAVMAIDFASLASEEGDAESALRHLTDVFEKHRSFINSKRWTVLARRDIARSLVALGRYEEARANAIKSLGAAREAQFDVLFADALRELARIGVLRETICLPGAHVSAARILGFVDVRLRALGSDYDVGLDPLFAAVREALGAETFANLVAEGATMTEEQAVQTAVAL
jgi:predicted ATPase/transcriptional regulator with XRE-family HTH domain